MFSQNKDFVDESFILILALKGNTALHIAVYNAKVTLVRALLVFEADTEIENASNQTVWMLALKQMQETGLMDSISIGVSLKENRRAVLYSLYAIGAFGCSKMPPVDVKGTLKFK